MLRAARRTFLILFLLCFLITTVFQLLFNRFSTASKKLEAQNSNLSEIEDSFSTGRSDASFEGTAHSGRPLSYSEGLEGSSGDLQSTEGVTSFLDYVERPTLKCNELRSFGGPFRIVAILFRNPDGNKMVCLDSFLKVTTRGRCNVYSFGINYDWTFDDAMEKYGCNVHSFDPSMESVGYKRGDRIHFYPFGIGRKDVNDHKRNWKLYTLKTIMNNLKHDSEDFVIDYLKMDIEGGEIDFFQNVLYETPEILKKIKQIGMEVHPGNYNSEKGDEMFRKYLKYFAKLEEFGYRLMYSALNSFPGNIYVLEVVGKNLSCCYELVWGKVS